MGRVFLSLGAVILGGIDGFISGCLVRVILCMCWEQYCSANAKRALFRISQNELSSKQTLREYQVFLHNSNSIICSTTITSKMA